MDGDLGGRARIALALPETGEKLSWGTPQWHVRGKGFVWDRPLRKSDLDALGIAEQEGPILGVRVADEGVKRALIADDPDVYSPSRTSTATRRCC
ncbi:hypothetical protein [Kutzneria kofuensis]|uniref:hypothetical protein n=1 Tax=Kutzneria kofuensis TaxID=103725 RepID=UPI0031ECD022